MRKKFELDFLGQYYASIINEEQSGSFSMTIHLKEALNSNYLKEALLDLKEQFPFLSGQLRKNFFYYEYEVIPSEALNMLSEDFLKSTNQETVSNQQVFKVIYGAFHFSVEVNHTLCDGRTLMKITKFLVTQYFERLGIKENKKEISDSLHLQDSEYLENAYLHFTKLNDEKERHRKKAVPLKEKAYRPLVSEKASIQTLTFKLSATKVKEAAKGYQATITEYLLAMILKGISIERAYFRDENPIIASIPMDCRSFFPTETMRNFVSAQTIRMPESEAIETMIKKIKAQFNSIDKELIYEDFSSLQKMYQQTRYVPRKFKDLYMKRMQKLEATKYTTGLSNLGMMNFPDSILNQIDFMEFSIDTVGETPYYFSCITVGDILTLKATIVVDDTILINELEKSLNQKFGILH